jgi:hypothetical protein
VDDAPSTALSLDAEPATRCDLHDALVHASCLSHTWRELAPPILGRRTVSAWQLPTRPLPCMIRNSDESLELQVSPAELADFVAEQRETRAENERLQDRVSMSNALLGRTVVDTAYVRVPRLPASAR